MNVLCIKDVVMEEPKGEIYYLKGVKYPVKLTENGELVSTKNEHREYEHIIRDFEDVELENFYFEHFKAVNFDDKLN